MAASRGRRRRRPLSNEDILATYCGNLRRSPRFSIASNPNTGCHKEEIESAAVVVPSSVLRHGKFRRSPRIALRNKDNQSEIQDKNSSTITIDDSIEKPVRRSPRFSRPDETQMRNCAFSAKTDRRTTSRFQHATGEEERKMSERNGINCGAIMSNGKDGRTESRVVGEDTQKMILDHLPAFVLEDQFKTPLARRASPRFVRCVSDGDNGENAGVSGDPSGEKGGREGAKRIRSVRRPMKGKCANNECKRGTKPTKIKEPNSYSASKGAKKRRIKESGVPQRGTREESEVGDVFLEEIPKRKSGSLLGNSGFAGWSKDQEDALERAYMMAKPSPHFWKDIAKLVPGKSAKQCFDRIHSMVPTPPSQQPHSRVKTKSPLGMSSFSGNGSPVPNLFGPKGRVNGKRKSILAHRLIRNILRRNHGIANGNHEVSGLSMLGGSFSVDKHLIKPITPICPLKSNCHGMSGGTMPNNRKEIADNATDVHRKVLVSPEILKKVKNLELHEKYIDRLHIREQMRHKRAPTKKREAIVDVKEDDAILDKTEVLKSAKLALLSDSRDVFKQMQLEAHEKETFSLCDDDAYDDEDEEGKHFL